MSGATNQQPAAEEDKKPGGDQSAHINLKVKGQVCLSSPKLVYFYISS